ncbi:MAG: flagellar filament protein FlaA [Treponematales bacterium]
MKRLIIAVMILAVAGALFAQTPGDGGREIGATDPNQLGVNAAQMALKEVLVDSFEQEGYWKASLPLDSGFIISRLFPSKGALEKEPMQDEAALNAPDENVLGVRVDFTRRGHTSFAIAPVRPIPIAGITKTVSVWVVGRNLNHTLILQFLDLYGHAQEVAFDDNGGKLNFQGWKKMTATIRPQEERGPVQESNHYYKQMGIKITGLRVECDPLEAYGSYYIYFDDMRAVTDLSDEQESGKSREEGNDDMRDFW